MHIPNFTFLSSGKPSGLCSRRGSAAIAAQPVVCTRPTAPHPGQSSPHHDRRLDAGSIFAGQVVAVATGGVSNNSATALGVVLAPQTISGTVTAVPTSVCLGCWQQYTVTLPPTSWLAILTGKTTVVVLVPPSGFQAIFSATPSVTNTARFHDFLFNNNGTLTMVGLIGGPGPGTPFDQH